MGDANRVKISIAEESSYGVAESAVTFQTLRTTGESLNHDMSTTTSQEMRSDRQISDIARIGLSASGDISFEVSYDSCEQLMRSALLDSAWSSEAKISAAQTISFDSTDNSINDSASGFGSYAANGWVKVTGASNSGNNSTFKIVSRTAAKMIVKGGDLTTESAGEAVTVQQGAEVVNGTSLASWNIEKNYEDLSNVLSLFLGMCVNTMGLDIPADGIMTGTFGFMGSEETPLTATNSSSYTAATTTQVMTGANHVPKFLENYESSGILSLAISLNNNLRVRNQVGTLGVVSVGTGAVEVTGTVTKYFETAALYNKFIYQTETSLAVTCQDTLGNAYVVELPQVKITSGSRPAGGLNTDVIGEFNFSAYMHPTEEITIRIVRFPVMENFAGIVPATSTVTGALTV